MRRLTTWVMLAVFFGGCLEGCKGQGTRTTTLAAFGQTVTFTDAYEDEYEATVHPDALAAFSEWLKSREKAEDDEVVELEVVPDESSD